MGRTARELSLVEREAYRTAWRLREQVSQAQLRARAQRALGAAREAADLLRREFGARRVWLFGSLARGTFGPGSDVDLAVEGLEGRELLRALSRIEPLFPETGVDLVAWEEASPGLRWRVESEGIAL